MTRNARHRMGLDDEIEKELEKNNYEAAAAREQPHRNP